MAFKQKSCKGPPELRPRSVLSALTWRELQCIFILRPVDTVGQWNISSAIIDLLMISSIELVHSFLRSKKEVVFMNQGNNSDSFAHCLGPSEMARVVQETDWSTTSIGAIETWPASLRIPASSMMHSRSPMFIAWGDRLTFLFNDAYRPILGNKAADPRKAMGKPFAELWPEIWRDISPLIDIALSGQGAWSEDMPRPVQRGALPEENYFTFSYSPILDDAGKVGGIFGAIIETTDKVIALRQLVKANEKLQLAADAAELGLFDRDIQADVIDMDERCRKYFGFSPDEIVSAEAVFARINPDDRTILRQKLDMLMSGTAGNRYEAEYRTIRPHDGKESWIAARGRMFFDLFGQPQRLIGTTMDITSRKAAEKRMREAALRDSLTDLPNRALLSEYCTHLLAAAERRKANCAVLFLDLDRFKPINDLHGHGVGDKVLQEVARRLRFCTRKEDVVSRLGGDEFIIVLPNIGLHGDAERVAQHIIDGIGMPIEVGLLQLQVTPSIGISFFRNHAKDLDTLIRYADMAMYAAKKGGRNAFRVYTPGIDNGPDTRLKVEVQLQKTIASEALQLFYQPIIDIASGRLIGAEALVRLIADNGAILGPAEFIPVAESSGLINQLGEWVITEAGRQHREWVDAGLPALNIAVNVSPVQFRQQGFKSTLAKVIQSCNIDPKYLQVEVTEHAVIDNYDEAVKTLNEIREMGVCICLDDFGTGYSSLSYLASLPLDKLKIDQSFVKKIGRHAPTRSITEAIIALGRCLGLQVVGEGVESNEALEHLRLLGCDQAQGFLYTEPLPAAAFESWCNSHRQRFH